MELVDFDPFSGTATYCERDVDGSLVVKTTQDVETVLRLNQIDRTSGTDGWTASRNMRHVARIPTEVVKGWRQYLGVNFYDKNDRKKVDALLNDSDYRDFRIGGGRI